MGEGCVGRRLGSAEGSGLGMTDGGMVGLVVGRGDGPEVGRLVIVGEGVGTWLG